MAEKTAAPKTPARKRNTRPVGGTKLWLADHGLAACAREGCAYDPRSCSRCRRSSA